MKTKRLIISLLLVISLMVSLGVALAISSSADEEIKTVGAMIEIEANLSEYRKGAVKYIATDGYIGIPVQVSIYRKGNDAVKSGVGGTPIVMYVVNTNVERVGTDSDVSIITSMLDRGYAVAVIDYLENAKASSHAIDWSIQLIRTKLSAGDFFKDCSGFATGTYKEIFVCPAGYDVSLSNVYWEIDKHSSDGTLEYIVEVWNEDFRSVFGNRVIKWVNENGNRKQTQNAFDGTSPVWLNSDGSENQNGEYIKIKYTKAIEVTDCTRLDGTALDYNLYMHITYPTNPEKDVPVMCLAGSGDHLASVPSSKDRPHFNGFLFSGYAVIMYDHGYVPMARAESYNEFSGADSNAVTGDNVTYSIARYNEVKIHTAAMRYIRYLALSDGETYCFDTNAIGVYGNSKGGWMTFLGEEHPEQLIEYRMFPGHHGETRYEAGKTETVGIIDGGEEQPWLTYNGVAIDSGADLVYACCGGSEQHITAGHAPTFISCNTDDNSYYGSSNSFVTLCKEYDIPTLWFESAVGHMLTYGDDINYGVDTYYAFFDFCNYHLKGEAVKVVYSGYDSTNTAVPLNAHPVVKFTGSVAASEIVGITITDSDGNAVSGSWSSLFGNTEWTFTPDGLLDMGETYTITVPASLKGDNGLASGGYTSTFTTVSELQKTVTTVDGALGRYYLFSVDADITDSAKFVLRIAVENDAANLVKLYSVKNFNASNPDAATVSSEAITQFGVFGKGYYDCDVTEYVKTLYKGDTAVILAKVERTAGTTEIFNAPLDSILQCNPDEKGRVEYEFANDIDGIEGSAALKVTNITTAKSSGAVENVEYYTFIEAFRFNFIVSQNNLSPEELGRKISVSFRIYDTTSRRVNVYFRNATSEKNGIADYGGQMQNITTVAGEWIDITLNLTIHEPMFGNGGNIRKSLHLVVQSLGDQSDEYPIYFDSVEAVETVTNVSLGAATLTYTEAYTDPLVTEYGRIGDNFANADQYPIAVFKKSGDVWEFVTGLTKIPTSFGTYGADTVLLFRKDCAIGTSKYDLDSIGEGRTLIFDLDGNTLDITNGDRYNAMTTSAGKSISFVIKNGRVYSDGKASLVCIYARGNNTVNLTFENLKVTVGANFGETQVLVRHGYDESPTHKATFNITLNDCNVDISAVSDSSTINVFSVGYTADRGNYALNWRINGGSLNTGASAFSAPHLRVVKAGNLVLGRGSDGQYLKMIYTADLNNGISAGFTDESGNTRYFGAVSTDGTGYAHQPLILKTAYGTIPNDKVSALKYPFVAFYNGAYKAADDLFANVNIEYALRSLDGATIVMRRDYSVPSGKTYQNLSHHQGTLIIDLCGFTINGNDSAYEGIFKATGMNTFATNLVVKNGKIVTDGAIFTVAARSGVNGKTQGFAFEDVVIESSSTILYRYSTPASSNTINIEFNNCVINSDTLASTSALFLAGYSATDTYLTANVTVRGGIFTLGKFNQTKFVSEQKGGTVKFLAGKDGMLPIVYVPTGTAMSGTAYKGEGESSLYLVEYANGEVYDEYRVESLLTPYGTIAYANSSRVDYPFLAFRYNGDGTYTYFYKSADFFKNGGMEWEIRDRGYASSVVLMRRDFHAENSNSNLGLNPNKLIIDLGGYTLTCSHDNGAISAYAKNATTTTLIIKNGAVLLEGRSILTFESNAGGAGKEFNISLENLKFEYKEGATVTSPYKLINAVGAFTVNMNIVDCVFDFSVNRPEKITIFISKGVNANAILNTNIIGGTVILDSFNGVSISNDLSKLTFKQSENGGYTTFVIPVKESAITDTFISDRGTLTLVKTNSDKASATYSLVASDVGNFIPKTSITLSSELVYNVYVPAVDSLKSFTVDGKAYGDAKIVTLSDGNQYYHIAVSMPASEAARNVVLKAIVTIEGKDYTGTWTMSIPKYAKKILDSDATDVEKTLIKDVLAYIKAVYIYFNADDKTEVVKAIDEILGDYNKTFAKVDGTTDADDGLWGVVIALEEKPAVRFVLPEGVTADGYIFKSGNTTLEYTVGTMTIGENTHYYADVSLFAYQMINQITYTDGTNSGCYHINSYYDYVTKDDELKNDANLISLVEKLYNYCKSAEAYRASVTNK